MRIAVCDDESTVLSQVEELLGSYSIKRQINFSVSRFLSGEELLMDIEDYGMFDLIYLDIELSRIDGISAARELRDKYPETILIFISSYSQYYRDAFDVQPFQFLDKPLDSVIFYNVLERAIRSLIKYPQTISFYYNRIYYNVSINKILYFESDRRIVRVVCENVGYEFYGKLSDVEERLTGRLDLFLRIHRSYLVNAHYIKELSHTYITMSNGIRLSISPDKRKSIRSFYLNWMSNR